MHFLDLAILLEETLKTIVLDVLLEGDTDPVLGG
jgi:hypothetical protein